MSEIKRIKIQNLIESQIPEFLNEESPLFQEFLKQYYTSQEYTTGLNDLAINLNQYKGIENFNAETFYNSCKLSSNVLSFDNEISVNSTFGFPSSYGLLKIDNEIITYTGITTNSFTGCVRGFSGIDANSDHSELIFKSTSVEEHSSGSKVFNLNLLFFSEIFKKFKSQYLLGFEDRKFYSQISLQNILTRAKDFYASKGTDTSYKLLFKVLYGKDISIVDPKNFTIKPSNNPALVTKNIVVEKISGVGDPIDLIGKTISQAIPGGRTASAAIYNVEYRKTDNRDLYEISLDSESFIYNFIPTKKTNVVETININSTSISVDSTVDFPSSGTVYIKPANSFTSIPINYQNKSANQFLNVSGINIEVPFNSDIIEDNFAYSTLDNGNILKFRIFNIIESVDYSKTSNLRVGDKIYLSSFGENYQDFPEYNSWMYNLPTYHNISNINGNIITTVDNILLYKGDTIVLSDTTIPNNPTLIVPVDSIISKNKFTVLGVLPNIRYNRIQKVINKSRLNPNISSRIQNTYIDTSTDNIVTLSSGLPDYKDIVLDNREVGLTITGVGTYIFSTTDTHYFYTGEKIHFTPSLGFSGLSTGTYFVNRYSNTSISLAYSYSNLYANNYIGIQTSISNIGTIVKLGYEGKNDSILDHQKLLKIFNINNKNNEDTTLSKNTIGKSLGLLINGVELYSSAIFNEGYYYGQINDIAISNSGKDYDVINAPTIQISDEGGEGAGAQVYANMRGTVRAIRVISPGIGYQVKPKISIIGGNGYGAVLESNLVQSPIISYFLGSAISLNVITFAGTHKFQDTEQVIYQNNSNPELVGLTNNSTYYVGVINSTQIKLYRNRDDSINKTNAIVIGNNDTGIYYLTTVDIKNTITEVYVKDSGKNYSSKTIKLSSSEYIDDTTVGISTFDNYILVKNHNLREKDIVVYSTTNTVISGLSTTNQYIVSVIDTNKFRLAEADSTDFYYNYSNNRFVNLNSIGSGTHTFKYPPIQVVVETTSGISSTTISPVFTPIVLGEFESLFIENYGTNYGSSDIINFNRRPNVKIQTPSIDALLNPIILEGKIVGVQILSGGAGYGKDIDIVIEGSGKYALLIPTVENGKIIDVTVVNSGLGYVNKKTSLQVVKRGNSAKFIANLTKWTLNQYKKYSNKINELTGEGILIPSNNVKKTLQYINFYPPKKLRDEVGDTSGNASPILGWAYDGNPIYGPYVNLPSSTSPSKVRSSYQLSNINVNTISSIRPVQWNNGDFIEDYKYIPNFGDLDEHNGMFIKTNEFPKGIYAYFTTLDGLNSPAYPYAIATEFKNTPIIKNFNGYVNQDLNLDSINFIRNTGPYYLNSENSGYLPISKIEPKYKQEFIVNNIIKSGIDSIGIVSPGDNFMVGDRLQFENIPNTISPSCSVSNINGVPLTNIAVGISTLKNVTFKNKNNIITGITTIPHNLVSNDVVVISSISSNQYSSLEGSKTISVSQKTTGITVGILSSTDTGVSTAISVNDVSGFNIDDYIKIDSEVLKIRDIKINQSQLLVDRSNDGGIHTAGVSLVNLLPTKFTFNEPKFNANLKSNSVVYFNPSNSIGLGTTGTTYIDYGNTTYFAPAQSIYIENHKYYTGQPLTYKVGIGGTGLVVSNSPTSPQFKLIDGQIVYAVNYGANFVGLSTLGFTTSTGIGVSYNSLYFRDNSNSLGNSHNFTTQYDLISGTTERYTITANTKSPHLLSTNDIIDFKVITSDAVDVELNYNSTIRKITTPPLTFNASTEVNVTTSTIYISDDSLQTGDKVVYTNSTNPSIGGLVDNERYFVLRESPNAIKLTQYYDDISKNNYVKLTSTSTGTHSIAKVNPLIYLNKGNKYEFIGIGTYIKLYKDSNYFYELEPYRYTSFTLDTINQEYPQELYYTLSPLSGRPVSLDTDVISGGRIVLLENSYDGRYSVIPTSDTSFRLNLKNKPRYLGTINFNKATYSTTSKTAKGPIKTIKVNQKGKFYNKIPKITSILTTSGSGELLTTVSSTIGKVDTLERVKDGFDYPTDGTLLPKLSIPTIAILNKVSNVKSVDVLYGGKNYNTPPNLKAIGNNVLQLTTELKGNSVSKVSIIVNDNSLDTPLSIVPVNNSNGFDIIGITTSSTRNSIELDTTSYPSLSGVFPFSVGDEIFIENCSITSEVQKNYNSKDYNYRFFKVTSVNQNTSTIEYDITGLFGFGTYTLEKGYGTVVNRKDMATFKMNITDDINYISGEKLIGFNTTGNQTFTGYVMEDGWDSKIKQIRINKSEGELDIGYRLKGELSNLKGEITNVNNFNLKSKLGVSRDKINYTQDDIGDLNNSLQKISDNNYYQNFSYAIRGEVPYSDWKEPVHSVIHPSGYREFSDLEVISQAGKPVGMKTTTNNEVTLIVKIDNEVSLHTRDNFAIAYDETQLNQSYAERISFGAIEPWNVAGVGLTAIKGIDLLPYILNNTNKVIEIDDISEQFTGTNAEINIQSNIPVTFNPQYPYNLGVSTAGLSVGDIVGYSTYHTYPENTGITSIGIESVFTLYPHKSYSGIVTESLSFSRRLNGNIVSGISSFKLTNKTTPLFSRTFNSNDSSIVNLTTYSFNINNHNLQTGQKIFYSYQGGTPIRIATTNLVLGGISTNILPSTLYVNKINDNSFQVAGLSTSIRLELTSLGIGTHKFTVDNPNVNALISIDNIIQKPIYNRPITLGLVNNANVGITSIYVNSGISSISTIDILKIDEELLKIINVGIGSTNVINVKRGFLGTQEKNHTSGSSINIIRGDYNIIEDTIFFTSPPQGPTGLEGLKVSSSFSGRVFSRKFDPTYPDDKNIIFDDISDQFTGLSTFILKQNQNSITQIYNNRNYGTDASNNPLIFINNILQVPETDFTIQNNSVNEISYLTGIPNSGKILNVGINTAFGYVPLIGAAATVSVSGFGTISNVYLTGAGTGYRTPPYISLGSTVGQGASIIANVGTSGTITGFTIVNPGSGYTSTAVPIVNIDTPLPYYNLDVEYAPGNSGLGTGAKVSISVASDTTIGSFLLNDPGSLYKVGDILKVVGLTTNPTVGNLFDEFRLTVTETVSDIFSGYYPGQFIQFNDISNKFNGFERLFDIKTPVNGIDTRITFKVPPGSDLVIENNFFILINGILQVPTVAYRYFAGRIQFTEPPSSGSTCTILFYRGSSSDVEEVTPVQTIKDGDILQSRQNVTSTVTTEQLERVVKRIVQSNTLDTFVYTGYGITNTARPLSWTKQTADRIINGSLISKSRTTLKSNITPNTFLIKSVGITDTAIYVNDAFPYFSELDSGPTKLPEFKRNINILDYTSLDLIKYEKLVSVKVKGDYGTIVGINTFISSVGIQTGRLEFKLKSNTYNNNDLGIGYSSLNTFGINSSQLEIGDYFVISNSNVICGHALTGITDSLGGMSNYPNSKVGTARSFIDGVYRVEGVTAANAGIVTVSCNFVAVDGGLSVNIAGLSQTTFYGNYSWGKFYDYDNRQLGTPKQFDVNTNDGLIGLSTSSQVSRTVPLLL